jgi:hypothetical protein
MKYTQLCPSDGTNSYLPDYGDTESLENVGLCCELVLEVSRQHAINVPNKCQKN